MGVGAPDTLYTTDRLPGTGKWRDLSYLAMRSKSFKNIVVLLVILLLVIYLEKIKRENKNI